MKVLEETSTIQKVKTPDVDKKCLSITEIKLSALNVDQEEYNTTSSNSLIPNSPKPSITSEADTQTAISTNARVSWPPAGILRQALMSFNELEPDEKATLSPTMVTGPLPLTVSIPFSTLTPATFLSNGATVPLRLQQPSKDDSLTVIYSSIPSMCEVKSVMSDEPSTSQFSAGDIILAKGEGDSNTSHDTGCYALQSPTEILCQLSKAGVLPAMSSSQVSSVLSALGSDSHIDLDHTDMLPAQMQVLPIEKVSTLTQTDEDSFMEHLAVDLPEKKKKKKNKEVSFFRCKQCPFLSLNKNMVSQHVSESHTSKEPCLREKLNCPGCSNVFFSTNSLSVHLSQDHQVAEPELQIIVDNAMRVVQEPADESIPLPTEFIVTFKEEKLEDCAPVKKRGRPRGSKNKPMDSVVMNKLTNETYRCSVDNCAVSLRSHDNIEYHRRCHRGAEFACPECEHVHKQWGNMTIHLWRSHLIDMELYSCDQCDYKTNRYGKLMNLHKWIHGTERPFLCDLCGKGFKNPKQLRNHKVTHKPKVSSVTECEVCSRAFSSKRMLRLHMEHVHNKFRPHLCSYCGYSVSSVSSLKMHMRKHTGEKPFRCDECKYCTSDHNSLRRHKMQHSGDKPYKCPHCTYACIQSSTFKVHLKTKHPGMDNGLMFSCNMCSFRSVKENNYIVHLAEHKQQEIGNHGETPFLQVQPADKLDEPTEDTVQIPADVNEEITGDPTDVNEEITGDTQTVCEPMELKFNVRKEEDP